MEDKSKDLQTTIINELAITILQFYESNPEIPISQLLEEIEKRCIYHALIEHGGCRAWAANFLKIGRTKLMYRISKFGKSNFMPPSEHLKLIIREKLKK